MSLVLLLWSVFGRAIWLVAGFCLGLWHREVIEWCCERPDRRHLRHLRRWVQRYTEDSAMVGGDFDEWEPRPPETVAGSRRAAG